MINDSEVENKNVKVRSVANLDGADAKLNWIFNAFDKDGQSYSNQRQNHHEYDNHYCAELPIQNADNYVG